MSLTLPWNFLDFKFPRSFPDISSALPQLFLCFRPLWHFLCNSLSLPQQFRHFCSTIPKQFRNTSSTLPQHLLKSSSSLNKHCFLDISWTLPWCFLPLPQTFLNNCSTFPQQFKNTFNPLFYCIKEMSFHSCFVRQWGRPFQLSYFNTPFTNDVRSWYR